MTQKTSKYAYNRNNYCSVSRTTAFNGNAARQLLVVPDEFDDDYYYEEEEEEILVPEREERRTARNASPVRKDRYEEQVQKSPKVKTRYKIKISFLPVLVFVIAITALLSSAFKYLEVQSDIIQTDKQIKAAENRLADVESLNASLMAALDTEIDRNYIYTVAVAKLGMVYPDNNQVVYYEPAEEGYVRQLAAIPMD